MSRLIHCIRDGRVLLSTRRVNSGLHVVEEVKVLEIGEQHLVGNLNNLRRYVVRVLLLGVLLNVPFPVRGVHAGRAAVGLLARVMTPHVLDDLGAPAAAEVAPVAEEVARLFLTSATWVRAATALDLLHLVGLLMGGGLT